VGDDYRLEMPMSGADESASALIQEVISLRFHVPPIEIHLAVRRDVR
jgi:hypothetical protein